MATTSEVKKAKAETTRDGENKVPTTRDEAAEILLKVLGEEPKSVIQLTKDLGFVIGADNRSRRVVSEGLRVLAARHQAKFIGKGKGWAAESSKSEAASIEEAEEAEFPYDFHIVRFDQMFVDPAYQRPLTSFAIRIERKFDPVLFQTLVLSDRGSRHRPKRFALIDGQTRWVAAQRRGHRRGPSIVFTQLSPEDEASIFWRLQKERRGVISWFRFRAQLASGDPESIAIKNLVEMCGYELGDGPGKLRSVAALEFAFRNDQFLLERTLSDLHAAFPDKTPESAHIRGLHYFFRYFPIGESGHKQVDDERLVRRLMVVGVDGLKRKAVAAKEVGTSGGNWDKWMGLAIQSTYTSR